MRELQLTILSHNGGKKKVKLNKYIYIYSFLFSFLPSIVINYEGSENEKEEVEEFIFIFTSVVLLSVWCNATSYCDPLWSKRFEYLNN